jgi:hypothetical protein
MTMEHNDLGGGHSPRELDVRTGTYDDADTVSAPVERRTRFGLARRTRVSRVVVGGGLAANVARAAMAAGLLFFGWRMLSASSARRSSRSSRRPWSRSRWS